MNFRDPDLILIKKLRGGTQLYFQVFGHNSDTVILKDIQHGGKFTFNKGDLEKHIKRNILSISKRNEVPVSVFAHSVTKREKIPPPQKQLNLNEEAEKRYKYVRKFLDTEINALTEKRLKPWIEATSKELKDPFPPSYKSLGRWIKKFQESGWKKSSLISAHQSKGNYTKRQPPKVEEILTQVICDYLKAGKRGKMITVYQDFVSRLNKLNDERKLAGFELYEKISYQAFCKRLKGR